jgi:hypothetical protein
MKQLTTIKVIADLNMVHERCPRSELSADGLSVASRYAIRRAGYTLVRALGLWRGRG